jgi:hypothetical protein
MTFVNQIGHGAALQPKLGDHYALLKELERTHSVEERE